MKTHVTEVSDGSTSTSLAGHGIVLAWVWEDCSMDSRFELVVRPPRENISTEESETRG
jgi:hypothetical protein